MKYIVASNKKWCGMPLVQNLSERTGQEFILVDQVSSLTAAYLETVKPRYIFFPHWSFLIPPDVFTRFECVIFHMTDVPFGRGGSPLQNLIARGISETKISALKCQAAVDAGPVYLKRPLSLNGAAEEIFLRATKVIEEMIIEILNNEPTPVEQKGEVVYFERRKPEEGDISELTTLEQIFDYIRMLDAEGYPRAFLETKHFRLEFQRPALKYGKVVSDVVITKKMEPNE